MRQTIRNPVDGVEIAYEVSGDGEPMLLVHGSGLSKGTWRGLGYLRDLERDFTVIAVDMRGHGRSGKPHEPAAYRADTFVGDIDAVLDQVALDQVGPDHAGTGAVHYVGYSFGARIGLRIAADQPERFRTLTVIGASFGTLSEAVGETFFPSWREALTQGGMPQFIERWTAQRGTPVDPSTTLAFLQNDPEALIAYFDAVEGDTSMTLDEASAISVPTLLLAGTGDTGRFDQSREAARRMPRGRFFELVGQDHGSSLLPVDEITDLIRTFAELARRT